MVIRIDKQAPTTTDNAPSGWQTSDVNVLLTCSDGSGSGCNITQYRIDSGAWQTYDPASGIVFSSDGNFQLDYNSNDAVGNIETTHTIWVAIDKMPPSTTDDSDTLWHGTNQTITLTPSDATSGVATTYYCIDTSGTCTPANEGTSVTTFCDDGDVNTQYIRYYSVDVAGNSETIQTSNLIKIDRQKPATSWDGNHNTWQNFDANIHLTCDDFSGSSCSTTKYRLDTDSSNSVSYGSWQTYNPATGIVISSDGNWAIDFNSTDNVGNIGDTNTFYVLIDKTPPSTTDNHSDGWHTTDQVITLTPSDSASGVSTTYYRIDSGSWQTGTSINITTDGNHQVDYYSTDNAGNSEATKTIWVAVDKTSPSTTDDAPSGWQTSDVTVTLTPSDATSGVDITYYRIDLGSWTTGTSILLDTDGNHQVDYYSTDVAGNTENTHTTWVAVDKTSPSIGSTNLIGFSIYGSYIKGTGDINATISDATSGVDTATCEYTTDGGTNWYSASYSNGYCVKTDLTISDGVSYTFNLRGKDIATNLGTGTASATYIGDLTAPTTTDDYSSYSAWVTSFPTISLSCSDSGAGCQATQYRVDSDAGSSISMGTWQTGTTISFTSDGNYAIDYNSIDNLSNEETTITKLYILIDTTSPTTTSSGYTDSTWNNSAVTVSLSCDDSQTGIETSGCNVTQYRIDLAGSNTDTLGSWQTYSGAFSLDVDGNYAIDFNSSDVAGNKETSHREYILIDTIKPVTLAKDFNNYNGVWMKLDQNLVLECSDTNPDNNTVSGCSSIMYRLDTDPTSEVSYGVWQVFDGNILFSSDGNYAIDFNSMDVAGNIEDTNTLYVLVDKTAPEVHTKNFSADATISSRYLIFDVNDVFAGVEDINVLIDGVPSTSFNFATHCTPFDTNYHCAYLEEMIKENKTYTITIQYIDLAVGSPGNSGSIDVNVLFTGAPQAVLNAPVGGEYIKNTYLIDFNVQDLNIQSNDDGNLWVSLYYSTFAFGFENVIVQDANLFDTSIFTCDDYNFADSTHCTYSWDTSVVTDGNYYVDLNIYDDADLNDVVSSNTSFNIDDTKPTITIVTYATDTISDARFPAFTATPSDSGSGVSHCIITVYKNGSVYLADYNISGTTSCTWQYTTGLNENDYLIVTWRSVDRAGNVSDDANSGKYTYKSASIGPGGGTGGSSDELVIDSFYVKQLKTYYPYADGGYGIELQVSTSTGDIVPKERIDSFEVEFYDEKDNVIYKMDYNEAKEFDNSWLFLVNGNWIQSIDYIKAIVEVNGVSGSFIFNSNIADVTNFDAYGLKVGRSDNNTYYFSLMLKNNVATINNFTLDCWIEDTAGTQLFSCELDEFVLNSYEEKMYRKELQINNLPDGKYNLFVSVYAYGSHAELLLASFEKKNKIEKEEKKFIFSDFSANIGSILNTTVVPIKKLDGGELEIKVWMILLFVITALALGYLKIDYKNEKIKFKYL
ncbi:MAG: OmpL47-type beta-barrel domain-containing protein [Candidatus Heimdallarchaeaceae archaeon]